MSKLATGTSTYVTLITANQILKNINIMLCSEQEMAIMDGKDR